jgi:hypothetical protein
MLGIRRKSKERREPHPALATFPYVEKLYSFWRGLQFDGKQPTLYRITRGMF